MRKNWREIYSQYKNIFWKNYNYYKEREDFRNFIELFLTLVAIIVLSVFALKPTTITIIEVSKEIKSKEETIKKMNAKIKNLQEAQNALNRQEEIVLLIDKALPSEPDPEIALRQVEAASNESGSVINTIYTSEVVLTKGKKIKTRVAENLPSNTAAFNLNLSLNGKYENLIKAIETYENLTRIMMIREFSLLQKIRGENIDTLSLNLGMVIPYYYPVTVDNNKGEETNTTPVDKDTTEKQK